MRSFSEILNESKKTYEFKIGIAGTLPEGCADSLESCLKKYNLTSISKGKATPIQERPLDFPQLRNMEVTYYDIEVGYPTTTQVLQSYVGNCCGIHESHVIVRGADDPRIEEQEAKNDGPYETILTKEELGGESGQDAVAGNRVMDLLKELETARKERDHDPMEAAPAGESSDIDTSENSKAVVGG